MIIYIKPVKLKKNEWKPNQNVFFNEEVLNNIIIEENLTNNMFCVSDVIYDKKTGILSNINLEPCDLNLQNYYLYYIKTENEAIVRGQDYFWGYVTNYTINDNTTQTLEITVDVLSSSLSDFNKGLNEGQAYIERTNNLVKEINDIHSDMCNDITNRIESKIVTPIMVNKDIDVFVSSTSRTFDKPVNIGDGCGTSYSKVTLDEKGSLFVTNDEPIRSKLIGYSINYKYRNKLPDDADFTIKTLPDFLEDEAVNTKYDDEVWCFPDGLTADAFFSRYNDYMRNQSATKLLKYVEDISLNNKIGDKSPTEAWLSIPVIFNIAESESIINDFIIDLSTILDENMIKNHIWMHRKLYLTIDRGLFSIPLDLVSLSNTNFIIYATRIYQAKSGIKFDFYKETERINVFYTLNFNLNNDLQNNEYQNWKNDLQLQYQSGMKGINNMFPELFRGYLLAVMGIGISALKGGADLGTGLGVASFGVNNIVNGLFNLYKERKQEKYQRQQVLQNQKAESSVLIDDAINKILFGKSKVISYGKFEYKNTEQFYLISDSDLIQLRETTFLSIFIDKPVSEDESAIETDQKQFGAIHSKYVINIINPLIFNDLTTEHLFWQGRILPCINPKDNFWLDLLNNVLEQGVYINKNKCQFTDFDLISTDEFIDINKTNDNTDDITIISSDNFLTIDKDDSVDNSVKSSDDFVDVNELNFII